MNSKRLNLIEERREAKKGLGIRGWGLAVWFEVKNSALGTRHYSVADRCNLYSIFNVRRSIDL
jgi:hypothetical protein